MSNIQILAVLTWCIAIFGLIYNNYPKSPGSYQTAHAKHSGSPSTQAISINVAGIIISLLGFSTGNFPLGLGVFLPCLILSIVDLINIFRIKHHSNSAA